MKYLHLVWRNLLRRKVRTIFTILSVFVGFVLFGMLMAIRAAFSLGVDMAGANRYLEKRYRRAHNNEFAVRAAEPASAFVPFIGTNLGDILCEHFERTVGNDNCVRFDAMSLQIPADRHRAHYVKAKVNVHRHGNGTLAIFHGPRCLAYYTDAGKEVQPNLKRVA